MRTTALVQLPQRSLRALQHAITLRGGVIPALRAGWAVWRREGFAGLRNRAARDDTTDYRAWVERYDTLDDAKREALGEVVAHCTGGPSSRCSCRYSIRPKRTSGK